MTGKTYWLRASGRFPCNIAYCENEKSFRKDWKELTDEPQPEIYCNPNGARIWEISKPKDDFVPCYLICVEPGNLSWPEVVAMIAHEAVHVAQFLWEQIGETNPGNEAEAYLVQSITREILKKMDMPERTPIEPDRL